MVWATKSEIEIFLTGNAAWKYIPQMLKRKKQCRNFPHYRYFQFIYIVTTLNSVTTSDISVYNDITSFPSKQKLRIFPQNYSKLFSNPLLHAKPNMSSLLLLQSFAMLSYMAIQLLPFGVYIMVSRGGALVE